MKPRSWLMIITLVVIALFGALPAAAAPAGQSTVPLFRSDGSEVAGSWSRLHRTDAGVTMTIHTTGLPQHTFTVWWVIFNNPELCSHGVPGFSQCGEGDLALFGGDPSIQSSVLYATGHLVGGSGRGNFGAHLAVGDTRGALFGPGLLNPHGAEIHLVVRSHGPAIPGLVNEQIRTFGGGCIDAPEGTGTPGPNVCTDVQGTVHRP
jgi:hypothetical protein